MKKYRFITGLHNVVKYIDEKLLPRIPEVVTKSTVERWFQKGKLPSKQDRKTDLDPYSISVNSFPSVDPDCNLSGHQQLAEFTEWSVRKVKGEVSSGNWPSDWLVGRVYFNSTSFHDLKKNRG